MKNRTSSYSNFYFSGAENAGWKMREQVAGVENSAVENAGVDSRGIATDEMSR